MKNAPYLVVYYLLFIMGFSLIKHFAGWNAHTFAQLEGSASNFVSASLAILAEIMLGLIIGVIFLLASPKPAIGKFIVWATASVIPVTMVFLIVAHFVLDGLNKKIEAETSDKLHKEVIDLLPKNVFLKKSGAKGDFNGYVTADNDSLGLIVSDTTGLAKVYVYVDSVKLGLFNFDTCEVCNPALQKRLLTYVIPMQSFSSEETQHNLNFISNNQCYVADHNIYIGYCRKPGRRFIIINNVYDKIRHLNCYEIGFEVDCKTPQPQPLDLF